jgi:hypothetical protein
VPDDQEQGSAVAAAAAAQPATTPSQPAPAEPSGPIRFNFEDALSELGIADGPDDSAGVSNEGTPAEPPVATAATPDAKPAPATAEGVKAIDAPAPDPAPDDQPKTPSRREAERLEHEAEIARLKSELETAPIRLRDQLRAEIAAEEAQRAAAAVDEDFLGNDAVYEAALRIPINDPRLSELSPDGVSTLNEWREERIERRAKYAPVERHFRTAYERRAADLDTRAVDDAWTTVKSDIGTQIAASAQLPGVDAQALQAQGAGWKEYAEHIHAAGAAWKEAALNDRVTQAEARAEKAEAEAERARGEVDSLRSQAAENGRAPAVVGRSASTPTRVNTVDPNRSWHANFDDALDSLVTNGTG